MTPRSSFFRIGLAVWACAGFCGLTWNQFSNVPEKTYREWVFQNPDFEGCPVFALNPENSVSSAAQPIREVLTLSVFWIAEHPMSLPPPVFIFEGPTSESLTKALSGLRNRMKNRDPPVA